MYSAVSLFSGAGGLDIGFHATGRVRSVACYEYDAIFSETLRLNRQRLEVRDTAAQTSSLVALRVSLFP